MELTQPFSLPDIRKYPKEVLIAVLLGLLVYFINRADSSDSKKDIEIARLNARIDTIRTQRVTLYDKIFFKDEVIKRQADTIRATDSLLRKATQPQVEKILKQNER